MKQIKVFRHKRVIHKMKNTNIKKVDYKMNKIKNPVYAKKIRQFKRNKKLKIRQRHKILKDKHHIKSIKKRTNKPKWKIVLIFKMMISIMNIQI